MLSKQVCLYIEFRDSSLIHLMVITAKRTAIKSIFTTFLRLPYGFVINNMELYVISIIRTRYKSSCTLKQLYFTIPGVQMQRWNNFHITVVQLGIFGQQLAYSQNLVPTQFFQIYFHRLILMNKWSAESDSSQNFWSGSI